MKILSQILQFARPFRRYWPKYLFFIFFGIIFSLSNVTLVAPHFDFIFQTDSVTRVTELPAFDIGHLDAYLKAFYNYHVGRLNDAYGMLRTLLIIAVAIVIASFLSNFFKYVAQRVLVRLRADVMRNMRAALFRKITQLHIGYFNVAQKGNILSIVSNDVNEIQNTIINSFQVVFREPLMILFYVATLFIYSFRLTIFTLVMLPIAGFLVSKLIRKLKKYANRTQSILGQLIVAFEETISGIRIVKAFNAQQQVTGTFDRQNHEYRNALKQMFNRQAMASPLSEFLGVSIVALIVLYAGYLTLNDVSPLSVGTFVTYFALYYFLLNSAKSLANEIGNINRGLASASRLLSILNEPNAIEDPANPKALTFENAIRYEDVSFSYQQEPVLKHVSLTIPKGSTVALVGHSGAGKSTMADLLPRFYDVTEGRITIDGTDIRDCRLADLTALMGIVTQEAVLFNDTVRANIAFGSPDATDEDVRRAALIANADEFISQLEQGYDTCIGDRGGRLSGGQRQRLAIARAVLKNPPILILDEATSALDTESERLVQEALTSLMKNRTSVVIAHRLSTIVHADLICVMDDGRIVEQGTHDQLMARNGAYAHLYNLQTLK